MTRILVDLLRKELNFIPRDGDRFHGTTQNARLVANAERYHRVMYYVSHVSWNLRDQHVFDTLKNILDHAGPDKKTVVWAHNPHIGDARFTDWQQNVGAIAAMPRRASSLTLLSGSTGPWLQHLCLS